MNRSAAKVNPPNDSSEEMRDEYSFAGGERGRHAHLFGEVARDESLVAKFWRNKGSDPQRFEKNETRFAKKPDFKLYRGGQLVAFCEVKTLRHDAWLDGALEQAGPGEMVGGPRPGPIYNRISNAVHTAARQLESVNALHEQLNFLVLVIRDKAAKREDLVSVLTGYWDPLHGIFEETRRNYSEGRIREEKRNIDLYVWMTPAGDGLLESSLFFFANEERREEVCDILGVDRNVVKIIQ